MPALMLRSYALEDEVQRLVRDGKHELAVLVAQTLLELRTEAELVNFVKHSQEQAMGEAALALLPSYNLAHHRVLPFVEALIGVSFRDHCPEALVELRAHVTRRNGVAHRGERVTKDDAQASVAAVLAMTEALHELAYWALGMEDDLEEERRQQREEDGVENEDLD
jgi:hypothetical protein